MILKVIKYGNLMGSPDIKKMMYDVGSESEAADSLWDDAYRIKTAFGLYGQSSSFLLDEPECPDLFPAVADLSFLSADPSTYGDASILSAIRAIEMSGFEAGQIKSYFVTHPHGDHFDLRVARKLPNAKVYAHPDSAILGAEPLPPGKCPAGFIPLNTPGHGTPHTSYVVDLPEFDMSACLAGDLIMSHAHYLSLGDPLSFADHEAGTASVGVVMDALRSRPSKYKMIFPGHDIPFFV